MHPQMPGYDSLLLHLLQKPTPEIFPMPLVREVQEAGDLNQMQATALTFYVMAEYC